MWYVKEVTYAANGSRASPTRTNFRVNKGILYRIIVYYPPGSAGTTYTQIQHVGGMVAPTNADGWFRADDQMIDFRMAYEINTQPTVISIYGYNTSTTRTHTVIYMIGILPKEWLQPVGAYEGIVSVLKNIFVDRFEIAEKELGEPPPTT